METKGSGNEKSVNVNSRYYFFINTLSTNVVELNHRRYNTLGRLDQERIKRFICYNVNQI